ncbi:hypothetical protein [Nostoc sp. 'Peltigera membranacea cyanobiont' 210A]|nr:hypothetical protein [Nostoc sp. 'Peltigera membranacea cyanobiont' 210A]
MSSCSIYPTISLPIAQSGSVKADAMNRRLYNNQSLVETAI